MGFWDNVSDALDWLGSGVENFGRDTARATKEFSQIQKLKGEISQANRQINTQYLRLGRKFYEEHKEDPAFAEDPMLRSITDNLAKAASCEQEITRLKAARESQDEAAAAAQAAHDAAAEDAAASRAARANSPEVHQANADDDIVDYQTVEPADESDFVADESDFAEDDEDEEAAQDA